MTHLQSQVILPMPYLNLVLVLASRWSNKAVSSTANTTALQSSQFCSFRLTSRHSSACSWERETLSMPIVSIDISVVASDHVTLRGCCPYQIATKCPSKRWSMQDHGSEFQLRREEMGEMDTRKLIVNLILASYILEHQAEPIEGNSQVLHDVSMNQLTDPLVIEDAILRLEGWSTHKLGSYLMELLQAATQVYYSYSLMLLVCAHLKPRALTCSELILAVVMRLLIYHRNPNQAIQDLIQLTPTPYSLIGK